MKILYLCGKRVKNYAENMISNGMGLNNHTGRKFFKKSINVWYGIRACWVENFRKINKRTPTLIR